MIIKITDSHNQSVPVFAGILISQLPLKAIKPKMKKAMYCGKNGNWKPNGFNTYPIGYQIHTRNVTAPNEIAKRAIVRLLGIERVLLRIFKYKPPNHVDQSEKE